MNDLALKRFFTRATIEGLVTGKSSDFISYVIRTYTDSPNERSYRELISEIYKHLSNDYRMEYYYKNTLLNRLLFLQHDYRKTAVLTELPIGNAKADFIMINGRGIVYEIKTERDNLSRLQDQISEYYKAFTIVNVVTYQENVEQVKRIVPNKVGIIVLTKRGALKIVRKAESCHDKISHSTIFKLLRKYEFEKILTDCGYELPKVSEFVYYKECYQLICKIDVRKLQRLMLQELKKRVSIKTVENCLKTQEELRFITYFDKNNSMSEKLLNPVLDQKFGGL